MDGGKGIATSTTTIQGRSMCIIDCTDSPKKV